MLLYINFYIHVIGLTPNPGETYNQSRFSTQS